MRDASRPSDRALLHADRHPAARRDHPMNLPGPHSTPNLTRKALLAVAVGSFLWSLASTDARPLARKATPGPQAPAAVAQEVPPAAYYEHSIGVTDPLENFGDISGVAGSRRANDSFAVDRANHRLYRFGIRGEILWVQGGFGSGQGQFSGPAELDVDGEDRIFVIDAGNRRIQVFDAQGAFLDSWGSRGEREGQFIDPVDIAVSRSGTTVYLLDRALGRVQRLRGNGDIVSIFSEAGGRPLSDPRGIAVAPDDQVWIADTGNDRLLRVSSRGTLLGEYPFEAPIEVAIGANSDVYVIEEGQGLVRRFDDEMNPLGGLSNDAPVSVGVTEGNLVYVAEGQNQRLERYTSGGEFETLWGGRNTIEGEFDAPVGLAHSEAGTLFVLDAMQPRAHRYTSEGIWRDSFGSEGEEAGRLRQPMGIDDSPDSTIYLADSGNDRIQRFSAAGSSPQAFGASGEEAGQLSSPGDIAVAAGEDAGDPQVFVADTGNHRIQRFDRSGEFELAWGSRGPVEGAFRAPVGIAAAPDGTIWVSDRDNHRLQAFDRSGALLRVAGSPGSAAGQLSSPLGLEADGERVWVADSGNLRVQAFVADSGDLAGAFGDPRAGSPGLLLPREVALGPEGRIYVADLASRRILVYRDQRPGGWRLAFYDNPAMAGHPLRIDRVDRLDFDWADGRPGPGVPADGFSLAADGYLSAGGFGTHGLVVRAEGGVRAWIDGRLLVDAWDAPSVDVETSFEAEAGHYYTRIEMQDPDGPASLELDWRPEGGSPPTATPRPTSPAAPSATTEPGGGASIHLPVALRAATLR